MYTEEYVQDLQAENERLRTLVDSLKAESEAQVSNLASLYVAVTSVHGALDRPTVLSSVQEIVTNLIGSEEMAIFETDAAHGRLTLLASMGIEPGPYQQVTLGEGAIGRAAATGERSRDTPREERDTADDESKTLHGQPSTRDQLWIRMRIEAKPQRLRSKECRSYPPE